jgi:hypothetical protein
LSARSSLRLPLLSTLRLTPPLVSTLALAGFACQHFSLSALD